MQSGYSQSPHPAPHPANGKRPGTDDGVINLGEVMGVLWRRSWIVLGTTALTTAAGGLYGLFNPTYRNSFQVLTKPATVETRVVTSLTQSVDAKSAPAVTGETRGFDETKLRLLTSQQVLEPVAAQLKAQYPDLFYWKIAEGIQVKPVTGTDIFEVIYQNPKPDVVKAVTPLLGESYLKYSLQDRKSDVDQGIKFIDGQLPELKQRVSGLQGQLQRFRQENQLFDPESQSREIADQISTFRKQRIENQVLLDQAKGRLGSLQSENAAVVSGETKAALILGESARYQSILSEIAKVDAQLAAEGSIFQEESENIKILRDQRAKLLPLLFKESQRLEDEASNKVNDLETRNGSLINKEDQLSVRMKNLSQYARQYTDIQRELQIATENLNQFLAKRSTLDIDSGQRQTPWQLLTPTTLEPSKAGLGIPLLLGGLGGLLLGSGLALLTDRARNVFYRSGDLKKTGGLPLLGTIPYNQQLSKSAGQSLTQTAMNGATNGGKFKQFGMMPFIESLRSLYTNIRLSNSDFPLRSITISSPTPQDGKSMLVASLAQVVAAMGQRVLVVDAELRRPQLHHRLGVQSGPGLSDLLAGSGPIGNPMGKPIGSVIQRSPLAATLDVLTAGTIPADPMGLLSSSAMQQLMAQFETEYDFVIYDTPPLGGFSDACVVAAHTGGLLLVTRLGRTDRTAYENVLEGLGMLPTRVLGVVANDSRQTMNQGLYAAYYTPPPPPLAQADRR
jgi:polysaccharide biosynthesis transport protein